MDALLDTGSTLSVLSPQIFEKIPERCKPSITPVESNLRMANGDTSTPQGKTCCKITIYNTEFWPQLTIADIEVPMIIGYDFRWHYYKKTFPCSQCKIRLSHQPVKFSLG